MNCTYLGIVRLLLASIMVTLASCSTFNYTHTTTQLPFQKIGAIPIINGRINGKPAVFIVDTGASISILDESLADYFGFRRVSHPEAANQNIIGLGGESEYREAYNYKVELGSLVVRGVIFRTNQLTALTRIIKMREKIIIAGIIGSDVLNRYRVSIDFSNNLLSFQSLIRVSKTNPPSDIHEIGFVNLPY